MAEKETQKVEHKNIFAALSAFQGELEPIEKSARVNFKTKAGETVDFNYAPLDATMKVIYPLLAKHGLSVRHELGEAHVECILTHETTGQEVVMATEEVQENKVGTNRDIKEAYDFKKETKQTPTVITKNEIRSGKLAIDTKKAEMKEVGGQITYGRRYTLGIVLGLATEEDKDAQLFEQSREKLEVFAFKQAKATLERAQGDELEKQVEFLKKELKLAEELEAGTGKKAPSIGLKAKQYKDLLTIAEAQKSGKKVADEQDNNGEETVE